MQHVNDFLSGLLGGSSLLWDVALGVLIAKVVASLSRDVIEIWLK